MQLTAVVLEALPHTAPQQLETFVREQKPGLLVVTSIPLLDLAYLRHHYPLKPFLPGQQGKQEQKVFSFALGLILGIVVGLGHREEECL
jgi:hypothetical protein